MVQDLKPVYLIYGEKYLADQALERLRNRIAEGAASLNVNVFSAASSNPNEVLQAADTLPFLGERHLVIVKDFDKANAADQRSYAAYAENPAATTVLVLMADKANKGSVIYKTVQKTGQVYEFKTPKDTELFAWVEKQFNDRGKKPVPIATRYIIEQVGTDLATLNSEIEKTCVYLGEKKIAEPQDLVEIIAKNPQNTIFELVDALGAKERRQALSILNRLFAAGEPPLKVLTMIVRQFRMILKTKALTANRIGSGELAKELGVPPFVVDKYRRQCERFSFKEIKRIYDLLQATDIAIKTGEIRPDMALEVLIGRMFA